MAATVLKQEINQLNWEEGQCLVIKGNLSLQSKGEGLLDGARKELEPGLWRRLLISVGV